MSLERFVRIFGGEGPTNLLVGLVLVLATCGGLAIQDDQSRDRGLTQLVAESKAKSVSAILLAQPVAHWKAMPLRRMVSALAMLLRPVPTSIPGCARWRGN
jgi:hypothetical protein